MITSWNSKKTCEASKTVVMNTWAVYYTVSLLSSVNITYICLVHQPMVGLHENRVILNLKYAVAYNGGISLKVSHVPTKLFSYFVLTWTTGESKKKTPKNSSWVELRTRRSLTNFCHGQTTFSLGSINLIYCQLKIE